MSALLNIILSPSAEWFNSAPSSGAAVSAMKTISSTLNDLKVIGIDVKATVSESGPATRPVEEADDAKRVTLIIEFVLAGADAKGKKSNPANYDLRVVLNAANPSASTSDAVIKILETFVVRNNTFVSTRTKLYPGQTSETVHTEKPVGFLEAIRDGASTANGTSVEPPKSQQKEGEQEAKKESGDGSLFGAIKGARNTVLSSVASAADSVSSAANDAAADKGKGLYVPRSLPKFTADELAYIASGSATNEARYQRTAQFTIEKLAGVRKDRCVDVDEIRDRAASVLPGFLGNAADFVSGGVADAAPAALGDAFSFGKGLLGKAAEQASKAKEAVAQQVGVATYKQSYVEAITDAKMKDAAAKLPKEVVAYIAATLKEAVNQPLPPRHGEETEAPTVADIAACVDTAYAATKWTGSKAGAGSTAPTAGTDAAAYTPSAVCPVAPIFPAGAAPAAPAKEGEAPSPIVNVTANAKSIRVLEQYHGATFNSSDLAAQLLPSLLNLATASELINQKLVLTVVCSDSSLNGIANLSALLRNGPKDINVIALYPTAGYAGALELFQQLQLGDLKSKSFGRLTLIPFAASSAACEQVVAKIYENRVAINNKVLTKVQEAYPESFIKEEKPAPVKAAPAAAGPSRGIFDTIGNAVQDKVDAAQCEIEAKANALKKEAVSTANDAAKSLGDTLNETTGVNIKNLFGDQPKPVIAPVDASNWASVFPRVVSFVQAYADLAATGGLTAGGKFDVVIPVGDLGNVLAAFVAIEMGIPIRRIVVSGDETPEGKALVAFLTTGNYDVGSLYTGEFAGETIMAQTATKNLERLVYFLTGKDSNQVNAMIEKLQTTRCLTLPSAVFEAKVRSTVKVFTAPADKVKPVTKAVFEVSGRSRVLHPTAALSVAALESYLTGLADATLTVVVADIHWATLPNEVFAGLGLRMVSHKDAGMMTPPGHEEPTGCCAPVVKDEDKPAEPLNKVMQRKLASIAFLAPKVQIAPTMLVNLISSGIVTPLEKVNAPAGGTVPAGPVPAYEPIEEQIVEFLFKNCPQSKEAAAGKK